MRALSLVSLLFVMSLTAGCDSPSATMTGPAIDLRAERSATGSMIPFQTSSYSFYITSGAPEAGCNATGESRFYLSGEGTASHLGLFTVTFSFCARPGGTLADGRGTFVAANGDELYFTFDGTSSFAPPSSVNFTSFAAFAGGTGRFVDASGPAVVTGSVDVVTGAGSGRWDGTISTVGTSKP